MFELIYLLIIKLNLWSNQKLIQQKIELNLLNISWIQ